MILGWKNTVLNSLLVTWTNGERAYPDQADEAATIFMKGGSGSWGDLFGVVR
jgi:hypothetical protein